MKAINQAISFLLVFQLFAGCQSSGGGGGPISKVNIPETPPSDISFEGTISKVSNFIFSSAHAAEGVMYVNDYSNPDDPIELTRLNITNQKTFSFSLDRTKVVGKLLKLHFVSSGGGQLSRQYLLTTDGTQKEIFAELSDETTARMVMIEGLLKREISEGTIDLEDVPLSFAGHSSLDLTSVTDLVGHEVFIKIMTSPETQKAAVEAIVALVVSKESGDTAGSQKSLFTLSEISENSGISKKIFLLCNGNKGQVSFNDGPYVVFAKGIQEPVIRKFSGPLNLGNANNWEEGNKIINNLVEILSELSDQHGENLQAEIYFRSNTGGTASCKLSGKNVNESEFVLNQKPFEMHANFERLEALTFTDKLNPDEFQKEATFLFMSSLHEFKWLLEGAVIDPSEKMKILRNEFQKGFAIIFPKIKNAREIVYSDLELVYELDLTSYETLSPAEDAIWEVYEKDFFQESRKF